MANAGRKAVDPLVAAQVVLYAVDLEEIRAWVGCRDEGRLARALEVVLKDEDADWEAEEEEILDRLLRRMVLEGELYAGLSREERYYLTQLLVDLLDEFVDPEAVSEDIRLDRFLQSVELIPGKSEAARLAGWIVRGRELGGEGTLWQGGPVDEFLPYLGYVTREELPLLLAGLEAAGGRQRSQPPGALRQLRSAAQQCARLDLDLVSFVGC